MICQNCKFWEKDHYNKKLKCLVGWCHRYPPSATRTIVKVSMFPVTTGRYWCGEFETLWDDPIDVLGLSRRASNCLRSIGITKIKELINHNEALLLKIRGFGDTCLIEVLKNFIRFAINSEIAKEDLPNLWKCKICRERVKKYIRI